MTDKNKAIARFHILLAQAGLKHEKESMLSGYGVTSSRNLTIEQLTELCDHLAPLAQKRTDEANNTPALRAKRSIVLTILTGMGIYNADDPGRWKRVNDYLKQPRIAGKLLYEMNADELTAIAVKLRLIKKKRVEKELNEAYKAANN